MVKEKEKANTTSSGSDPTYVLQLTDAEKNAREVLDAARKRKAVKMKKAKDEAIADVETIKIEYEGKLTHVTKTQTNYKDTASLQFDKDIDRVTTELRNAFKNNRAKAVEIVIEKVLDVKVEVHKNF